MNNTTVVASIIFMLFCSFSEGSWKTAEEVINDYDIMVEENTELASRFVPNGAEDGRLPMKNLFYLRPVNLTNFLLANIHFNGKNPDEIVVMPAKSVEDGTIEGSYLCYLALLESGFDMQSLFKAMVSENHEIRNSFIQFHMLGRRCAGSFFDLYVEKKCAHEVNGDATRYLRQYLSLSKEHFPASWRAELEHEIYNPMNMPHDFITDQGRKFKEMESLLTNTFSIGKQELSNSITNTISAMGHIRSLEAVPVLAENLTICPQVSTNVPGGYVFPAAEALIEIGPAIGYCFGQLEKTAPLSVEESLWLRISHELYPEGLEYDLMRRAETNDTRAARLLGALPWRRLDENYEIIGKGGQP